MPVNRSRSCSENDQFSNQPPVQTRHAINRLTGGKQTHSQQPESVELRSRICEIEPKESVSFSDPSLDTDSPEDSTNDNIIDLSHLTAEINDDSPENWTKESSSCEIWEDEDSACVNDRRERKTKLYGDVYRHRNTFRNRSFPLSQNSEGHQRKDSWKKVFGREGKIKANQERGGWKTDSSDDCQGGTPRCRSFSPRQNADYEDSLFSFDTDSEMKDELGRLQTDSTDFIYSSGKDSEDDSTRKPSCGITEKEKFENLTTNDKRDYQRNPLDGQVFNNTWNEDKGDSSEVGGEISEADDPFNRKLITGGQRHVRTPSEDEVFEQHSDLPEERDAVEFFSNSPGSERKKRKKSPDIIYSSACKHKICEEMANKASKEKLLRGKLQKPFYESSACVRMGKNSDKLTRHQPNRHSKFDRSFRRGETSLNIRDARTDDSEQTRHRCGREEAGCPYMGYPAPRARGKVARGCYPEDTPGCRRQNGFERRRNLAERQTDRTRSLDRKADGTVRGTRAKTPEELATFQKRWDDAGPRKWKSMRDKNDWKPREMKRERKQNRVARRPEDGVWRQARNLSRGEKVSGLRANSPRKLGRLERNTEAGNLRSKPFSLRENKAAVRGQHFQNTRGGRYREACRFTRKKTEDPHGKKVTQNIGVEQGSYNARRLASISRRLENVVRMCTRDRSQDKFHPYSYRQTRMKSKPNIFGESINRGIAQDRALRRLCWCKECKHEAGMLEPKDFEGNPGVIDDQEVRAVHRSDGLGRPRPCRTMSAVLGGESGILSGSYRGHKGKREGRRNHRSSPLCCENSCRRRVSPGKEPEDVCSGKERGHLSAHNLYPDSDSWSEDYSDAPRSRRHPHVAFFLDGGKYRTEDCCHRGKERPGAARMREGPEKFREWGRKGRRDAESEQAEVVRRQGRRSERKKLTVAGGSPGEGRRAEGTREWHSMAERPDCDGVVMGCCQHNRSTETKTRRRVVPDFSRLMDRKCHQGFEEMICRQARERNVEKMMRKGSERGTRHFCEWSPGDDASSKVRRACCVGGKAAILAREYYDESSEWSDASEGQRVSYAHIQGGDNRGGHPREHALAFRRGRDDEDFLGLDLSGGHGRGGAKCQRCGSSERAAPSHDKSGSAEDAGSSARTASSQGGATGSREEAGTKAHLQQRQSAAWPHRKTKNPTPQNAPGQDKADGDWCSARAGDRVCGLLGCCWCWKGLEEIQQFWGDAKDDGAAAMNQDRTPRGYLADLPFQNNSKLADDTYRAGDGSESPSSQTDEQSNGGWCKCRQEPEENPAPWRQSGEVIAGKPDATHICPCQFVFMSKNLNDFEQKVNEMLETLKRTRSSEESRKPSHTRTDSPVSFREINSLREMSKDLTQFELKVDDLLHKLKVSSRDREAK